nr:unnamed protein product [Spirometra erinaceieuropaei]
MELAVIDLNAQSEDPNAKLQEATSNQLTQQLENLQAADENVSVEIQWYQLRDAVHKTFLGVLERARCQHQDWFDENDEVISNLLVTKNRLHRACIDRPTGANKAVFSREKQDVWMACMAEEIQ